MIHPRTGSVLILNGEIYNYIELRAELEAEGLHFKGKSDTEVLLHALEHWGIDSALKRLNGMWAFAWLDIVRQRLFLSRDRCGEKPLYLALNENGLFFSSEMKTILTLLGGRQKLDLQTVGEYLRLSLVDIGKQTMIAGLEQVQSGTYTDFSLSDASLVGTTHDYWHCPVVADPAVGWTTFVDQLRDRFLKSVEIRLRSDVPVGILLSGGLDSSSIAGAAKILGGKNIKMLSAVSGDPRFDESPFIDAMARYLDWPVTKVQLPRDPDELFGYIEEATWYMDAPLGSLSNVAHYLLMKAAKIQGITVVLSGQGADELLCGYRKYLGFFVQSLIRKGRVLKAASTLAQFCLNGTILNQFNWGDAKRYLPDIFQDKRESTFGHNMAGFSNVNIGLRGSDTLNDRQVLDLTSYSVPTINHSEDRMSMAWSREIRLPFLDPNLIEMLISAPASYKLNKGWTKYALRCAMQPALPAEIAWRKDKQGFANPEGEWLKHELKAKILNDYFSPDANIFKLGIIDRAVLLKHYQQYCSQQPKKGRIFFGEIFNPMALEVWLRRFGPFIEGVA